MNKMTGSPLGRLRQPEYTGENRCLPCTVVNLVIAAGVTAAVAVYSRPAALAVGLFSLGAIYFRGYLVPGTPTLTKRYLPDRVLRLFDDHEDEWGERDFQGTPVDPETVLSEAAVLEPCDDGDICLTDEFRTAWWDGIDDIRAEEASEGALAAILGADADDLTIEAQEEAHVARVDGMTVAQWESEAALVADLAAEPLLAERYDDWEELDMESRGRALLSLRIFLESCPTCGGRVALSQETVESCCREIDVVAATCEGCGERILELEDLSVT